jgi:hypothetical protein
MGKKIAALAAAIAVLPCASSFSLASTTLPTHRKVLGGVELHSGARRHSSLSLRTRTRSERSEGPRMMTVIDAVSSPLVLTAGAVGTMDGLRRVAANVPQLLETLNLYAKGWVGKGLHPDVEPVDVLRKALEEREDVRAAILKICMACDRETAGTVDLQRLNAFMLEHGERSKYNIGGDVLHPRLVSARSLGEAIGMSTKEPFDYVNYFRELTGSPEAYDRLRLAASQALVADAYEQCRVLTAEYAKTFYLATRAMPEDQARATWAIYAWCVCARACVRL